MGHAIITQQQTRQKGGTNSSTSVLQSSAPRLCPRGQSARGWDGCPGPSYQGKLLPSTPGALQIISPQATSPNHWLHLAGPCLLCVGEKLPTTQGHSLAGDSYRQSPLCGENVSTDPKTAHLSPTPKPCLNPHEKCYLQKSPVMVIYSSSITEC